MEGLAYTLHEAEIKGWEARDSSRWHVKGPFPWTGEAGVTGNEGAEARAF